MPRLWKDRIVQKPRTFNVTNNPDGTITLTPNTGTVTEAGTPVNSAMMNGIEADLKFSSDIQGTVQTPTYSGKNVTKVEHKDSSNEIIRTDTFDYSQLVNNIIIETRTLDTGEVKIFKYHTDTGVIEVI